MITYIVKPTEVGGYSVAMVNTETAAEVPLRTKSDKVALFESITDATVACRMAECYGINPDTGRLGDERVLN